MIFLKNYTIKSKIRFISLSAMMIIIGMLGGLLIFSNYLQKNFDNMQKRELEAKNISYQLTSMISTLHTEILTSSLLQNIDEDTKEDINDLNSDILDNFNKIEQILVKNHKTNTLKILKKLKLRYAAYYSMAKNLPNEFKEDDEDKLYSLEAINSISERMFEELELFIILADKKFNTRINDIKQHNLDILTLLLISGAIALVVFLVLDYLLRKTIMHSLYNLDSGIEDFFRFLSQSRKDVHDIEIVYNDELGEIAEHINDNIHEAELLIKNEREFKKSLEKEVNKQTKELKKLNKEIIATQKDIINTMGMIGESRSKETGDHVKRVAEYSLLLAKKYGLSKEECDLLYAASPMHDIGKVGIGDDILKKPGKLTQEEFAIMQTHTTLGYEMLKGSKRPILSAAATISYEHHEKWNGKGYPNGKAKEDIHIFGRITALADVFDALGSDRCYKKAWKLDKILNLLKEERGEHFDPKLVDIFLDNLDEFLAIRDKYKSDSCSIS